MIGKALSRLLIDKGYDVIILTRSLRSAAKKFASMDSRLSTALWSIRKQTIDPQAIQQADHIIHLAGANVGKKRWSRRRKREIVNSRIKSSALLVKALAEIPNRVKTVVSASGIGWYGVDTHAVKPFVETDPSDPDFLGETCRLWEESIEPVTGMGKRLVKLRTGIVLSNEGGAFPAFKRPIRFGIAAILGNGKQIISWIHIEDLCRIYLEAIINENMSGVYNAVAPQPVSNKTFTLALAKKIKGRFFIPFQVPEFMLKWMMGEMSVEVLKSTNASAAKIKGTGFQFVYPGIEAAFNNLIH